MIAVIIAFVASFRAAKRVERVQVTARDVRVTHETPTSSRVVWESPTAFTRVAVEKDEERTVGVNLMLSGREIPVAAALSPRERGEFAAGPAARDLGSPARAGLALRRLGRHDQDLVEDELPGAAAALPDPHIVAAPARPARVAVGPGKVAGLGGLAAQG